MLIVLFMCTYLFVGCQTHLYVEAFYCCFTKTHRGHKYVVWHIVALTFVNFVYL
jgi:hypothetical protein